MRQVLIVEDDVHFGGQIVDLFEAVGLRARLATTGRDALKAFRTGRYDLVLCDLMLPEMNGMDIVRAIRELDGGEDVPVMMMSAVYRKPKLFERELRDLGIIEFLPKPFSIVELGRRVKAVVTTGSHPIVDSGITQSGSWSSVKLRSSVGEARPDFDRSGSFDRMSLLNLMVEIFDQHHAGKLTLEHGRAKRVVCFLNGYPVWGESNDPAESLAAVLQANGDLSATSIGQAVNASALSGRTLRDELLHSGMLSERSLFLAERRRVRAVVVAAFSVARGEYHFEEGDGFAAEVGVFEVNPVSALCDVVHRYFAANDLAPDVYAVQGASLTRGDRYRQLFPYLKLEGALETLGADLRSGVRVEELFTKYAAQSEDLLRVLWLMLKLDIARRRADVTERLSPEPVSIPRASMPRATSEDSLEPFATEDGLDEASRTIVKDYLSLMEADAYTLLAVPRDASPEAIDASYEARMRRYSLTRLPPSAATTVRAKAKELLMRLLDAYETLSDPQRRQAYDRTLR